MTVGSVSFKILPLLLLFYINYPPITCQNCGLPTTIYVNEPLAESLDTGQPIFPPILANNVVSIANVTRNPGNFTNVRLIPETMSTCAQISLEVAKPLWKHPSISYVDETRIVEIEVEVELTCRDGRTKGVQFIIEIIDENTAMPHFEKENYVLNTEPCMQDRCALIFDTDILVIDKDRDEDNAKLELWTDMSEMINFLHGYSTLQTWYNESEDGGFRPKGYQASVKLEYVPRDKAVWPSSISFTMYARNVVPHADGFSYNASSHVTIYFEENPHRLLAPVFTSPLYYAIVEYEGDQVSTEPGNIYASVPGQYYNQSDITYMIEGEPNVFQIDCSGNLSFIKNIGVLDIIRNTRVEYNVTAERNLSTGESVISSTVPLIVFFLDVEDSSDEPPCDCESSTSSPGPTCPSPPTCPAPDPCPDPTTTEYPMPPTVTTETPEYTTEENEPSTTTTPEFTDPPTPTTSYTTTTLIPPTIPPGKCRCDCADFTCQDPQVPPSLNSTRYSFYPDPYSCTKYHRCPNTEDRPVDDKLTFECPPATVFCPVMTACTTVEMCIKRTYQRSGYGGGNGGGGGDDEEEECQECQCYDGFPPGHPENLCTPENHLSMIPDKRYYDVFHKCQPLRSENQNSYIDYPFKCQAGLVFCPNIASCGYIHDPQCFRQNETNLIFHQCDVCIMGLWEGFDIFRKTFV